MIRLLISILLTILALSSNAQAVKQRIEAFTKEQSIDTFLIYNEQCIGYIYTKDDCYPTDTHYIIWKRKKKYFIKQFETCHTSNSIRIKVANPLSFYIANRQAIAEEEMKPAASMDHSCQYHFSLNLKGASTTKSADEYDFTALGKEDIINAELNQKTKFKSLIDQMLSLIAFMKTKF